MMARRGTFVRRAVMARRAALAWRAAMTGRNFIVRCAVMTRRAALVCRVFTTRRAVGLLFGSSDDLAPARRSFAHVAQRFVESSERRQNIGTIRGVRKRNTKLVPRAVVIFFPHQQQA